VLQEQLSTLLQRAPLKLHCKGLPHCFFFFDLGRRAIDCDRVLTMQPADKLLD
jgi:hypothetical protein